MPGAKLTLALGEYGELEVVTPGPGVPLENYRDHVMGMMSSETHHRTDTILSKQTLYSAVTDLLVPVLTKLPEDTPPPLPSSPNPLTTSPLSHRHTKTSGSARTQGTQRDSRSEGIKVEGADVCSQLPSSRAYHDYIWRRADSVL
ncbi:hypothetical protein GBAR_LOCUS16617 [Geodia barretti]|uniref:Uncharacterized protein n=1 Tax=Geodia barretti TaxID=519541 RepID=A0AA35WPP6_GEOBA|nr:hypothetical protein GBAR_LOCUS16617 [Geodia barretti]